MGDKSNRIPFTLASPTLHALEMGSWLTRAFRNLDRIFDAIIYTSRSDNIMRYSDEVRARRLLASGPCSSVFMILVVGSVD
jgi:hypothetical protein